jgi:hypothetical protein
MLYNPNHEERLGRVAQRIRLADAVTPDLIRAVMADGNTRRSAVNGAARAHVEHLIDAGAWTDAALGLVELERPVWSLRCLVYDDGEWHCCLSRQRDLPAGLDETADGAHEDMALAILAALVEARGRGAGDVPSAQRELRPLSDCAVCCENFS